MDQENKNVLIAGLGNPGRKYEKTRHNMGFMALDAFALEMGWSFHKDIKFLGEIASGLCLGSKIYLLKPLTFMNNSGSALRAALDYFKIELDNVLVLADDKDIPFGEFRLKKEGSSGGHNGLKSIIEHLGSESFARLKIGIGEEERNVTEHVLGNFTKEEQEHLPGLIEEAVQILRLCLKDGVDKAMNAANVRGRKTGNKKIDGEKDEKGEETPL